MSPGSGSTPSASGTESLDVAFEALTDGYRRRLLFALLEHNPQDVVNPPLPDGVTIDDEQLNQLHNRIVHIHLPKLERGGFVEWERGANRIRRGPRFDEIRPVLECLIERSDEQHDRPPAHRERVLLEQNNQLKDHIRAVSHDLRGLLAVAGGHTELAIETGDRSHLDSVSKAVARADELLSQLETLAVDGEYQIELETVDLRDIAENVWSVVKTEDAKLVITESKTVTADTDLLQQLLENLFSNSVKHAGPDVTVRLGVLGDEGFYVEDDGPGIPVAKRSNVFELGESGDTNGTGIGLAICEQVADVHGWSIDVTDGSEGGARFEVDFGRT